MKEKVEQENTSGLQVKVSRHGSPRIAQLLQKTVFGTEGKLRYQQKEIVERIKSQANVQFIEILKSTRVLGTVGMANRLVSNGDDSIHSLYVRYLSIAQPFKSRKQTSAQKNRRIRERKGSLRNLIANEITSHFEEPFIENERTGAFYAYVESANINSRNLCISMGFHPTRKIETLLFSRFNPGQKRSIHNIADDEQDNVREQLKAFYRDYSFYFEDRIFQTGFYLVKKEKGKIIGGIRAVPVNWHLVDYPGFEGWLMQDVLPHLPFTNRLFQPDILKFIAFDYAWHLPDREHVIPQLMSHCCSLFGINLGMIWGDMKSGLIKNLKSGNDLGFVHSIIGSVKADLMVRPINFTKDGENGDEEIDEELEFPLKEDESFEIESNERDKSDETENIEKSTESIEEENESELTESEVVRSDDKIEPQSGDETSGEKKDDLKGLREILKRPIFVSALDMT